MIDQSEEFKKCARSFTYFCENYVKILHPSLGLIPFKLYNYQKRVAECYDKHKYNLVVKFRQGGLSTETVVWLTHKAIFSTFSNTAMFVSKSDREAKQTGRIVDTLIDNLPEWLKPNMPKRNVHEKIFLDSKGAIYFLTTKAARSRSVYYLVIDEAAFIKDMDDCWADLFPTIAAGGGKCIVISTPNGLGNWYSNEYHKALKGENNFNVIDIDVSEHPYYSDEKWLLEQRKQLGEKRFSQEVLKRFQGNFSQWLSTSAVNDLDVLTRNTPPSFKRYDKWDNGKDDTKGAFWVWKTPVEGRDYIIAADCGEGVGEEGDNSAFQIIDIADSEQVGEFYSNNIQPYEFADVLNQVGQAYNQALLIVEKKSSGIATLEKLEKMLFYPNLYGKRKGNGKPSLGFDTNQSSRQQILDCLQASIINKTVKINSSRLVKEFNTFVYNPARRRPEASNNYHDDLIFSLAIALKIKSDMNLAIKTYMHEEGQSNIVSPYEQNTRDIIRKEIEDLFLNDIKDFDIPMFYENGIGLEIPLVSQTGIIPEKSAIGRDMYLGRQGHSILSEFNW